MDLESLAEELGLDREGALRIVRIFLDSSRQDLRRLELAIHDRDAGQAAGLAHHLKGAAANLELEVISAAALAVEQAARSGNLEQAGFRLNIIAAELASLEQRMAEVGS